MRRGLLATFGVAGLMLAVSAGPAAALHLPPPNVISVEVGDEATLVARGAAVRVPVEVTCPAGSTAFVSASVTQRAGSRIASGFGDTSVVCTGGSQTVEVTVNAQGSGQAFKKGSAVAEASVFVCDDDFFFCAFASDSENIQIVR
jgi:hypothetical protein